MTLAGKCTIMMVVEMVQRRPEASLQLSHVSVAEFRKSPGVHTAHILFVYELSDPSIDLSGLYTSRTDPVGMS